MIQTLSVEVNPKCNVCKYPAYLYEEVNDCRLGQYELKKNLFKTPKFKAKIYRCHNCSHFFLYGLNNISFYEDEYSEWQGAKGYFGQLKDRSEIRIEKYTSY